MVEELYLQHARSLRHLRLRARQERPALRGQPHRVGLRTLRTLPGYVAELLIHAHARETAQTLQRR